MVKPRTKQMGEGGFGAVYRGMQPDGTEIAVKAPLERGERFPTFVGVFFWYTSSQVRKFSVHLYASQFSKILEFQKTFIETW